MNPNEASKTCNCACSCQHHIVAPIAITLIGLIFLLGNFAVIDAAAVSTSWPILLMIIGLSKLCKCCGCGSK
ncbi:MAG: hypothetical protein JWO00_285 [Candidatus Parcubacteria bacterium]|nr:hypothetical protein [Candidatus Parcubacteria bacterium]